MAEAGHRELLEDVSSNLDMYSLPPFPPKMPENEALSGLAGGLVEAWKIYDKPETVIMFLIEDVTFNICDQKFHEFEIRKQCPEVFVIRKTLTELGRKAELREVMKTIVFSNLTLYLRIKAFGSMVMKLQLSTCGVATTLTSTPVRRNGRPGS